MINLNVSWAEKYRPKDPADLILPKLEYKPIIDEWFTNKPDGNIILYGKAGTGKTSLAEMLITCIIKNRSDIKRIVSRSVAEIDTLNDFVRGTPQSSICKIVYIEEADRLSKHSMIELKEKYTEHYQDTVCFILTTNHPHAIDEALMTRFVYQLDFSDINIEGVIKRLTFIINSENAKYNEEELKTFVTDNIHMGMREMINKLQISNKINGGRIIFADINLNQDIEDKIIGFCIDIINKILNEPDAKNKYIAYNTPVTSIIGNSWMELVSSVHNNYGISFVRIMEDVYNAIHFQPMKNILARYMEEVHTKKYPHLHLMASMSEIIMCAIVETI